MTTLLSPDDVREHAPTTLSDTALQRLLDDADAQIVAFAGPLGSVTEIVRGGGSSLVLARRIGSVTSITETRGVTTLVLAADDWRQWSGYVIARLTTGTNPRHCWAPEVAVVYTPVDDTATRKIVELELVKLEIANNPGLTAQTIGSWSEQYAANSAWNPEEARASILARLREPRAAVV